MPIVLQVQPGRGSEGEPRNHRPAHLLCVRGGIDPSIFSLHIETYLYLCLDPQPSAALYLGQKQSHGLRGALRRQRVRRRRLQSDRAEGGTRAQIMSENFFVWKNLFVVSISSFRQGVETNFEVENRFPPKSLGDQAHAGRPSVAWGYGLVYGILDSSNSRHTFSLVHSEHIHHRVATVVIIYIDILQQY